MSSFFKNLQNKLGKHSPKEIDELILDYFWTNKKSTCYEIDKTTKY